RLQRQPRSLEPVVVAGDAVSTDERRQIGRRCSGLLLTAARRDAKGEERRDQQGQRNAHLVKATAEDAEVQSCLSSPTLLRRRPGSLWRHLPAAPPPRPQRPTR